MAAEFIGSTVLVTLRSPPNGQVRGIVGDIVGQQLTLLQVTWLASGLRNARFPVDADNILDLEVAPEPLHHNVPQSTTTHTGQTASSEITSSLFPGPSPLKVAPSPTPAAPGQSSLAGFVDPAILSVGKLPPRCITNQGHPLVPQQVLVEALRSDPKDAIMKFHQKPSVPVATKPRREAIDDLDIAKGDPLATATLSEPFDDLTLSATPKLRNGSEWVAAELESNKKNQEHIQSQELDLIPEIAASSVRQTGKRTRRGTKSRGVKDGSIHVVQPFLQQKQFLQVSPLGTKNRTSRNSMKSTNPVPLVEADASLLATPMLIENTSRNRQEKKPSKREIARAKDAQSGWATEDATDIQEMGDFDFAGNLSKFDKRGVFEQLKKDDTTADEARLVSHNRLPSRIGTAGGKNLHWTENVLELPKAKEYGRWTSEAGESDNEVNNSRMSSGRSSRRDTSQNALRRPQSRKGSTKVANIPSLVDSRIVAAPAAMLRYPSFDRVGSPNAGRNMSTSPFTGSTVSSRPTLRIEATNKLCPCLTPLQTLEFEQFASSELGITEEIMTENAARGIAETSLRIISSLPNANGKQQSPNVVIVIAAGNHKTGARAIAAGRHLRNHGFRTVATIMGLDRDGDLLDSVRQQASAYTKVGGVLLRPNELLEGLKKHTYEPRICIDALLGIHICFDDMRRDDQQFFFELVIWLKRDMVEVFSLDVPSGLDPSTGEPTIVEEASLTMASRFIISLGAPKPWLLAPIRDWSEKDNRQLFVVDIGISNLAWKRLGNRRSRGIEFGAEWVVKLRHQGRFD